MTIPKPLPSKSGLSTLDKSGRTINDYAKLTPLAPAAPRVKMVDYLRSLPKRDANTRR